MPEDRSPLAERSEVERLRYWLRAERWLLLQVIAAVPEAGLRTPLGRGEWSVHEIVAHRLFWEGREVEALRQYQAGQRVELLDFPLRRLDATNAVAVETMVEQPTSALRAGLALTRERLLGLAEKIQDEALRQPGDAARTLLGVALEHDREHRTQIEAGRAALTRDDSERPSRTSPAPSDP